MAMGTHEKRFDSDSSDSESVRQPWFPPPPTAPVRNSRVRVRETPRPVGTLPPLPPQPLAGVIEGGPRSPLLERVRSKRRSILERIEGWWDLGLIEKRQTLFGGSRSPRV